MEEGDFAKRNQDSFRVDFRSLEKEKPRFVSSSGLPSSEERKIKDSFGGLLMNGEPRFIRILISDGLLSCEEVQVVFRRTENNKLRGLGLGGLLKNRKRRTKVSGGFQSSDKVEPRFVLGEFPKNETRRSRFVLWSI
ncbi:unnamed protein product [Rhizophagus irregularis]|nr:unnamed protein product [Rhizophagus irregularis]